MFGKLLKHELKSSAPIMLILNGIIISLGIAGAIGKRVFISSIEGIETSTIAPWLVFPGFILFYAAYFGIIVCAAAAQYIPLFRFYGSRFTDRGYLTFPLPVSVHHNFLSAALNMLIWFSLTTVVYMLTYASMFLIGFTGLDNYLAEDILTSFWYELEYFPPLMGVGMLIMFFAAPVYSVAMNMTAVVAACSVFKRLKVLGCIGFMYALQMIASALLGGTMMICILPAAFAGIDPTPMMAVAYAVMGVIMMLLSVGGYFLSTHLMKKKLNLS